MWDAALVALLLATLSTEEARTAHCPSCQSQPYAKRSPPSRAAGTQGAIGTAADSVLPSHAYQLPRKDYAVMVKPCIRGQTYAVLAQGLGRHKGYLLPGTRLAPLQHIKLRLVCRLFLLLLPLPLFLVTTTTRRQQLLLGMSASAV